MVEIVLRIDVSPDCCPCEIRGCFFAVLLHALTQQEQLAEHVLGILVSLRRGLFEPVKSAVHIFCDAFPGKTELAHAVLRELVAMRRCPFHLFHALSNVSVFEQQLA